MSKRFLFIALSISIFVHASQACIIPVFRYALERWEASNFDAFLFYEDSLTHRDTVFLDEMVKLSESPTYANIFPELSNISEEDRKYVLNIWEQQKPSTMPWLVIQYPASGFVKGTMYAGDLPSNEKLRMLVDSPLRKEIGRRIRMGETAVWVLLGSGNRAKDKKAGEFLKKQFRRLEKELKLPQIDETNMPDWYDETSGPKLGIRFSTVFLSKTDPGEKHLISMLLEAVDSTTKAKNIPIAFPVFGRGRCLTAVPLDKMDEGIMTEIGQFLTGECSCVIKDMNPGYDLLMAVDWMDLLHDPVVQDDTLPSLTGIGAFVTKADSQAAKPETNFDKTHQTKKKTAIEDEKMTKDPVQTPILSKTENDDTDTNSIDEKPDSNENLSFIQNNSTQDSSFKQINLNLATDKENSSGFHPGPTEIIAGIGLLFFLMVGITAVTFKVLSKKR